MTRPAQLAQIAAEAEGTRLRGMVTRTVKRVVLAVIAFLFIIGAMTFAHIAAWYWIQTGLGQSVLIATGILGGVDVLVAIVIGLAISRSRPSRIEREALAIRHEAVEALGNSLSLAQMAPSFLRLSSSLRRD